MKYLIINLILTFLTLSLFSQSIENDGYKKFFYKKNIVSSEGYIKDGKPDGYWKSYYENGNLKSEGNRVNFIIDGEWKFYDENGNLNLSINYKQGKKNGVRVTYILDEFISENFVDDVKDGLSSYYNKDSIVIKTVNYINGDANGWMKEYDITGKIIKITRYKSGFIILSEWVNRVDRAGNKQGKWVSFYDNDNLEKEENYFNGKLSGYCKYYDKNGNLKDIIKYENGILIQDAVEVSNVETRKDYYSNGKPKYIASYRNNVAEGIRREYDSTGNIIASYVYENGNKVGEGIIDEQLNKHGDWKDFYKNGNLRAEGTYNNGKKVGKWTYYYLDGNIEQIGYFDVNGLYTDTWIWYYSSGEILREESFSNGKEDGLFFEYSENGLIIVQGSYISGFEDGLWIYTVNNVKEQGHYVIGKKDGVWTTTNSDGILIYKNNYVDGNLDGKQYSYYNSGKIKCESCYSAGLENDEWYYFDELGEIYLTVTYSSGKEIKFNDFRL